MSKMSVGGLIRVQVKTGQSAFKSPVRDAAGGTVTGWWFHDGDVGPR